MKSLSISNFRRLSTYSIPGFIIIYFYFSCSDKGTEPDDDGHNYHSQVDTVYDIDGNEYHTVTIGEQIWMVENLKVTHFRNGDPIPIITSESEWASLVSPACCGYANSDSLVEIYGLLYNWSAVSDTHNLAPQGWHVPTDEEWKQLELFLGMDTVEVDWSGQRGADQGGQLKETGLQHWNDYNMDATNSSRFTALPGGYRFFYGTFNNLGNLGTWWTETESDSTKAWSRILSNSYSGIFRADYPKNYGFSVRCVKD